MFLSVAHALPPQIHRLRVTCRALLQLLHGLHASIEGVVGCSVARSNKCAFGRGADRARMSAAERGAAKPPGRLSKDRSAHRCWLAGWLGSQSVSSSHQRFSGQAEASINCNALATAPRSLASNFELPWWPDVAENADKCEAAATVTLSSRIPSSHAGAGGRSRAVTRWTSKLRDAPCGKDMQTIRGVALAAVR